MPPQDAPASLEVVNIAIEGLKPHPRQAELFGDLSDAELQALADDIAGDRQRDPIQILPDGTIIGGHQRVRALKLLGRTTVRAVVRHDLDGKPDEITELFIADNLNRRHLHPLAIAACYLALREALKTAPIIRRAQRSESHRAAAVARLAAMGCHITERSLNRYVKLLALPQPIQDAIIAKRLTMRDGASILDRPRSQWPPIAEACKNGKGKVELAGLVREMRGGPRPISGLRISNAISLLASLANSPSRLRDIAHSFSRDDDSFKRFKNANAMTSKVLKIMLALRG